MGHAPGTAHPPLLFACVLDRRPRRPRVVSGQPQLQFGEEAAKAPLRCLRYWKTHTSWSTWPHDKSLRALAECSTACMAHLIGTSVPALTISAALSGAGLTIATNAEQALPCTSRHSGHRHRMM